MKFFFRHNFFTRLSSKRDHRGFTLIELLVVIAIIGLLATLSVIALNSARLKARDARRVSDIKQLQTALEMYYSDVSSYPAGTLGANVSLSSTNGFNATPAGTVYMSKVPTNPTPVNDGSCGANAAYTYAQVSAGASYTLSYCLSTGAATATPAGMR